MTTMVWTVALLLPLASLAAWASAAARGRGFRPPGSFAERFGRLPLGTRLAAAALACALWAYGGAKPGRARSALPPAAPEDAARALADEDFRRGFVMTRIGTGEAFDFSPPPGAVACDDWRAFGAAEDWIYLAFTNRPPGAGADGAARLRVFSSGKAERLARDGTGGRAAGTWFAPLQTTLGIVPEANWNRLDASARPSRFWHAATSRSTLLLTWQNALLGRDAERPVSFQAELFPDGRFAYRYDLSRLDAGAVTNVCVGASLGGDAWTTNALPADVTSMAFHPLTEEDRDDPDADGDGLPTVDELFLHGTDPHRADTDRDGLTDYEELFLFGTDPLNPRSVRGDFSDGVAARLGGLDPFARPEGSTSTVLEHVFYSSTTNGAFALPQSSESMAVLRVSASGSGTGDLIVGNQVVPLAAPPRTRSAPSPAHPPLLVPLARGRTHPLYLRAGDGLPDVSLDSEDFAFGVLPTRASPGWINFPLVRATEPCIHDFNARRKGVSLPAGRDANLLTCTWRGNSNVEVENNPPSAATITGNFSARGTSGITYTLTHPEYLFGQTTYSQTVRFCPQPPDPDPEDPDPPWYSDGDGDASDDNDDDHDEHWCCHWGACSRWCICECTCGGVPDEPLPGEEGLDEACPEHSTPYEDCAPLHADDYTNAVQRVPRLGGVLYIREPPSCERIRLDVPAEHRNCCPCPDHRTNHVGVAYKSRRLRLVDADGRDFERTESSCDVLLSGVSPSAAVGDAALAFARNGEVYRQYAKTVLGVAIRGGPGVDLAACNALSHDFGYPMTVCTNEWNAPEMRLAMNVRLPDGNVHLELANATGQFAVWHLDRRTGEHRRLLDSATTPVKNLPMAYWKTLMRCATDGGSAELPIWITSSAPGAATLVFRYWNVIDGRFVQDEAAQRITSLLPPLRLDVSRDGRIDDGDAAAWFDGRTFYYWINEDTVKGDRIGQIGDRSPNANDLKVNGTFDLVNFFPVALDLSSFTESWQDRVTYTLRPEWGDANSFNFCLADVPWSQAGTMQTATVTTLAGEPLSAASLEPLSGEGYRLDPHDTLMRFSKDSGLVICEAKSSYATLRIDIKAGDTTLYSYSAPMTLLPVKKMYGWINGRGLSGGSTIRATAMHRIWDEQNTKSLIFLHGANVSEAQAETWGDILFKRMWVSGVRADFYNVDWRSDIGAAYDYHENASNAFAVASRLAPILSGIGGDKVVMAHSLGNMVVSSMIQDYGLKVSRYIMCNSAVPAEAYDTSLPPENVLVHKDWDEYPRKSFANEWYRCFEEDAGDDRQLLTWSGRFSDVASKAVNFYSTGDHVLELYHNNNIWPTDGYENWSQMFERYSWHKQELWKGRKGMFARLGTTDWAGWSIRENILGYNAIQPTNAWLMSRAELRTNTVFTIQPESMNMDSIPLLLRNALLAKGVPSRTPASGATKWGPLNMDRRMINLESTDEGANGLPRPNGWIIRTNGWFSDWGSRWLHSDIKDVSYFFVFKFYQRLKEEGSLQ